MRLLRVRLLLLAVAVVVVRVVLVHAAGARVVVVVLLLLVLRCSASPALQRACRQDAGLAAASRWNAVSRPLALLLLPALRPLEDAATSPA